MSHRQRFEVSRVAGRRNSYVQRRVKLIPVVGGLGDFLKNNQHEEGEVGLRVVEMRPHSSFKGTRL